MAIKISRILHAGYLFEAGVTRILCDPLFENPFSRNCYAFPAVQFDIDQIRRERFDAVFISHYHDDHLSFESLDLIDRKTPIYLFCIHEEMFRLLRELGFKTVYSLELGRPVRVGAFILTAHPALDRDVDSILEILENEVGGVRVLNVVDSWIDQDVFSQLRVKTWDLVLWPFQTMRELEVLSPSEDLRKPAEIPHEWLEQIQQLDAKNIVPSSCQFRFEDWSWMNSVYFPISSKFFERAVNEAAPRTNVVRMNPGQSFDLSSDSFTEIGRLPWLNAIGDQSLDYSFDPNVTPSSTADIALKLGAIDESESIILERFLTTGIFERFARLNSLDQSWFDQTREWRLSIYDHEGHSTDHFFQFQGRRLLKLKSPTGSSCWRTEVVARKLLDALENGESLTSMYLRVDGGSFSSSESPDLLEDPLLRVLFADNFGSYQRAQLVRLKQVSEKT